MLKIGDKVKIKSVLKDTDLKVDYNKTYIVEKEIDIVANIQRIKLENVNYWFLSLHLDKVND
jgi:hypothetical protein